MKRKMASRRPHRELIVLFEGVRKQCLKAGKSRSRPPGPEGQRPRLGAARREVGATSSSRGRRKDGRHRGQRRVGDVGDQRGGLDHLALEQLALRHRHLERTAGSRARAWPARRTSRPPFRCRCAGRCRRSARNVHGRDHSPAKAMDLVFGGWQAMALKENHVKQLHVDPAQLLRER